MGSVESLAQGNLPEAYKEDQRRLLAIVDKYPELAIQRPTDKH